MRSSLRPRRSIVRPSCPESVRRVGCDGPSSPSRRSPWWHSSRVALRGANSGPRQRVGRPPDAAARDATEQRDAATAAATDAERHRQTAEDSSTEAEQQRQAAEDATCGGRATASIGPRHGVRRRHGADGGDRADTGRDRSVAGDGARRRGQQPQRRPADARSVATRAAVPVDARVHSTGIPRQTSRVRYSGQHRDVRQQADRCLGRDDAPPG